MFTSLTHLKAVLEISVRSPPSLLPDGHPVAQTVIKKSSLSSELRGCIWHTEFPCDGVLFWGLLFCHSVSWARAQDTRHLIPEAAEQAGPPPLLSLLESGSSCLFTFPV